MSYPINKSNGSILVTLEDGQLDTTTSVGLVGRNYVGYGEIQNENFLHLLENFASSGPPQGAIAGQLWFDTTHKILNVYDDAAKSWNPVGSATVAQDSPTSPMVGQLWLNSSTKQLEVYSGSNWVVVGPESIANFGETKARSVALTDTQGTKRPVIELVVNNTVVAIIATSNFNIASSNAISGFDSSIVPGINISNTMEFTGNLNGTADYALRLSKTPRINGKGFDGASDITITASTTKSLKKGNYLLGSDFDGSSEVTLSVDATADNTANKVVVRNNSGNFSANEITATLKGQVNAPAGTSTFDNITVNSISGATISGTASYAKELNPGSKINGTVFTGKADITVSAEANTLTGSSLATNVIDSKLQTLGILQYLQVGNSTNMLTASLSNTTIPTLSSNNGTLMVAAGISDVSLTFYDKAKSTALGLANASILPSADINLGSADKKFNYIYATEFKGTASSAYYADLAENYVADEQYEPGTVVQFGGDFEVTVASNKTPRVAGVVSTNPAYLMNALQEGEHVVAVALQGKVPCKVAGYVSKGDMMISGGQGYAIAAEHPKIGTVIGKALEDFHGEYGVINIVVGKV